MRLLGVLVCMKTMYVTKSDKRCQSLCLSRQDSSISVITLMTKMYNRSGDSGEVVSHLSTLGRCALRVRSTQIRPLADDTG
jgi:hypothetical protein